MENVNKQLLDALKSYISAGFGNSTDFEKQGRAYDSAIEAIAAADQAQRPCQYCDGTGDVHSITGEWRGVCSCEAGRAQQAEPVAKVIGVVDSCGDGDDARYFQGLAAKLLRRDVPEGTLLYAQPPAQQQAECGSCDGFDSGCEECSGLGKDGHLAALRQLANVAHRVAHAMGLPAGFDVTTLPDVVVQRLAAQQQAVAAPLPPFDVFSNDDGDSWETHPASDNFVHGLQLGEEFELLAGWQAERVTFRVTKVPDDESDDYEVEEVTAPAAAQKGSQ